jgi:chorismate synthase
VVALHVPVGLGSHVQADRRLDGRLAQAFMSIQAVKGVEVGWVLQGQTWPAPRFMMRFFTAGKGLLPGEQPGRGIEGGISNGSPVVIRAAFKPIPTLYKPLQSVDMDTRQAFAASGGAVGYLCRPGRGRGGGGGFSL